MTIYKQTHPAIFATFEIISHDRGTSAGHHSYEIPDKWERFVPTVESALATLEPEELETFCIGEWSEQVEIGSRSTALSISSSLLNAFFEEWTEEESCT